ncbi:unnamed protein product, partial [Ectocarpus sp. 12 AP-2014]
MGTSCSRPLLGPQSHCTNTDELVLQRPGNSRNRDRESDARATATLDTSRVIAPSSPDPPASRERSPPGPSPS